MFKYELLAMVVAVLAAAWFAFGPSINIGGVGNVGMGGFFTERRWKWARVLGSVIALYAVIYFIPQTHWWIRWVWVDHHWWLVLLAHILIVWGYMILPENPLNPADRRLARWVVRAATILLLITFGGIEYVVDPLVEGKMIMMKWKGYLPRFSWYLPVDAPKGMAPNVGVLPTSVMSNATAQRTYEIIMSSELARRNHNDALALFVACGKESGYRQFEDDGETPLIGRNEDAEKTPNGAIGNCQIKPEFWGEKANDLTKATKTDYRLETLDGNTRMAVWIALNEPKWKEKWSTMAEAEAIVAKVNQGQSLDDLLKITKSTGSVARGTRGTLPTFEPPAGWKPGDPMPADPIAAARVDTVTIGGAPVQANADYASDAEIIQAAAPKGKNCTTIEVPTEYRVKTKRYKLGEAPLITTGNEEAYWRVFDQNDEQVGQINGRTQKYFITQSGVTEVSFDTYKLSPEGETATIFLTPCTTHK